ncbi:hypothetical protein E2542_SST24058 [Spatholobus suberectus]|nr:hypothetical protein E2542_SST24058 [Spatholobus suberectus]
MVLRTPLYIHVTIGMAFGPFNFSPQLKGSYISTPRLGPNTLLVKSCVIHRAQEHQGSYGVFCTVAPPPSPLSLITLEKPTLLGSIGGNCHRGGLINVMELLANRSPELIGQRAFAGDVRFHPSLCLVVYASQPARSAY